MGKEGCFKGLLKVDVAWGTITSPRYCTTDVI